MGLNRHEEIKELLYRKDIFLNDWLLQWIDEEIKDYNDTSIFGFSHGSGKKKRIYICVCVCVCVCVRVIKVTIRRRRYPCGIMVKALDCGIVVSEFELQSCYYVHFLCKYPWERYEPPYPPSYGLNSTTTVLLERWLWH